MVAKDSLKPIMGLSRKEVRRLRLAGYGNKQINAPSKSVKDIITSNVFTYFNFVFLVISALLLWVRSYRDLTFLPIIFANTAIGILQEMRAKVELDKIMLINIPKARVVREGKEKDILIQNLVKGDVVIFALESTKGSRQ